MATKGKRNTSKSVTGRHQPSPVVAPKLGPGMGPSTDTDPTALEYWLERAAIAEYCGGLTRQQAEDSATKQLRVWEAARRMRDASK